MTAEFKIIASPISKTNYQELLTCLKKVGARMEWPKADFVYTPTSEIEPEWIAGFSEAYLGNCAAGWYSYDVQSQELWHTLLGRQYAFQVATADEIIDLGYVNRLSRSAIEQALVCWHLAGFEPELELELEVVKHFKDVPEVQSVYTDIYLNRKRFLILTSNEKYDDALMDQLLSIEQDLRLSRAETAASFVYIPNRLESVDEIVSRDSKLVYERGHDVIFVGSLMASGTEREASQATA
jgi:hypothetical protein